MFLELRCVVYVLQEMEERVCVQTGLCLRGRVRFLTFSTSRAQHVFDLNCSSLPQAPMGKNRREQVTDPVPSREQDGAQRSASLKEKQLGISHVPVNAASLQLDRRDVVFEEFLSSVFAIFFIFFSPNRHRHSRLGQKIKRCAGAHPGKHRHQAVAFLIPRKLLASTRWHRPAQNLWKKIQERDDACCNKRLRSAECAEGCRAAGGQG